MDTGASHTIISPDILEEIGVSYETSDPVYEANGNWWFCSFLY
ncbi:hypothetical protein ACOI1C_21980 [Bacillus sp. DJP31]